jgi:hypothetical protein
MILSEGRPAERVSSVENSPEFSQRIDRYPRTARCDRCAYSSIAHPCRDLARQTRPDLDVKDLTPGTPSSAIDPELVGRGADARGTPPRQIAIGMLNDVQRGDLIKVL